MYWGSAANDKSGLYKRRTRWDALASEIASEVHSICPRWLLFVQGVGHCLNKHNASHCDAPSSPNHQNLSIPT